MGTPNMLAPTQATPDVLASAALGTSAAALVTAGANNAIIIATASVCNVSGSTVTFTIGVCPSTGSMDTTHHICHSVQLAPNDSRSLNSLLAELQLGAGDFIYGFASAVNSVNFVCTGTTFQ